MLSEASSSSELCVQTANTVTGGCTGLPEPSLYSLNVPAGMCISKGDNLDQHQAKTDMFSRGKHDFVGFVMFQLILSQLFLF